MKRVLLFSILLMATAITIASAQRVSRQILVKPQKHIEIKSPKTWMNRLAGYDEKKKAHIYQDPKPRVEIGDARSGIYLFKWIGFNGKGYQTTVQRSDCIDLTVSATVTRTASGFEYQYTLENLKSSGCHLNMFAVQTLTADLAPKRPSTVDNVFILEMAPDIFGKGIWMTFGPVPPHPKVGPGNTLKVKLFSSAPPGLVGCRVLGGENGIKGVEDPMPEELAALLDEMGYGSWPRGLTVGPIDALKTMSREEKIAYLLNASNEFSAQGWSTPETAAQYQNDLRRGDLAGARARLDSDLKAGRITSEVVALLKEALQ